MTRTKGYKFIETDVLDVLRITDLNTVIPDRFLPKIVRLAATFSRGRYGPCCLNWYANTDHGIISLPDVIGDGSESLAQLTMWLEARGYERTPASDESNLSYARRL